MQLSREVATLGFPALAERPATLGDEIETGTAPAPSRRERAGLEENAVVQRLEALTFDLVTIPECRLVVEGQQLAGMPAALGVTTAAGKTTTPARETAADRDFITQ